MPKNLYDDLSKSQISSIVDCCVSDALAAYSIGKKPVLLGEYSSNFLRDVREEFNMYRDMESHQVMYFLKRLPDEREHQIVLDDKYILNVLEEKAKKSSLLEKKITKIFEEEVVAA